MKIQGSTPSAGRLLAKLGDIQNVTFVTAAQEVAIGVLEIATDAKRSIAEHQSVLEIRTRYNPRREAEVSEPDNPPNSDLGKLAQSIESDFDPETLTGVAGTNYLPGKWLELGTSRMAARPWLYPAFQRNAQKIRDAIAKAVQDAIQGGGDAS